MPETEPTQSGADPARTSADPARTSADPARTRVAAPKEEKRRKRVYKTVAVTPGEAGFTVTLDGRVLHTPGRARLETPAQALADAVAGEWDAQGEYIDPLTMPLTKLLNTSLDRVAPNPSAIITELIKYTDGDMLCYRAQSPAALVERQTTVWQPVLDWLEAKHGLYLEAGEGLMPIAQAAGVPEKMQALLLDLDVPHLTAVQATASLTSSLALSLALAHRHLNGAEVAAAAVLDESWQLEQWGQDKEALARIASLNADIQSIETFLNLHD